MTEEAIDTTTVVAPTPEENVEPITALSNPDVEPVVNDEPVITEEPKTEEEDSYDWVPKKYMRDGVPDFKALEKARANLEKKLGQKGVSLAPDSIDDYDYKIEGLPVDEVATKAFKEEALAAGLSKDQYEFLMKKYESNVSNFIQTPEKAASTLKTVWGDDYMTNMGYAKRAFDEVVPSDVSLEEVGNNPAVIKILAAIGRDLEEDTSIRGGTPRGADMTLQEVEALMKTPEYHQNGSETRTKVTEWFKRNNK